MSAKSSPWRNYLFLPSTYCDLSVWLLNHYGIKSESVVHTIPFLQIAIARAGGVGTMPLQVCGDVHLNNIFELTAHFESRVAPERKLIPSDEQAKAEVERLYASFDKDLGLAAAQVAYFHLLPRRDLLVGPFKQGCPWWEGLFVSLGYPLIAWLIRKKNKIEPATIPKAIEVIDKFFDEIDERLADGRRFLVGDAPTLADFGFADMAFPITWVEGYQGTAPPFDDLPQELKDVIEGLRKRPAGQFAMRIYREFRA